jgi:D-glycero-D-manno-heptose 1,7-bisphosphate phosphatase
MEIRLQTLNKTFFASYELILFDRDGVINEVPKVPSRYILNRSSLILNQVILKLIVELQLDFKKVAVITNQQCVGKGLISLNDLNLIHKKIDDSLKKLGGFPLKFYICTHLESLECKCRKPKPGLFELARKDFMISKDKTIYIGDSPSDEEAAKYFGIKFLNYKHRETSSL